MRYVFLLFLISLSSACSSSFDNKMNEMALICGEGYDPQKSYILVTDAQQSERLGLISLPKDSTPVTAKGCIERPEAGEVFVTNTERTEGVWVSAQSQEKVELAPLSARKLPSACNSVVHGDGRGFTLKFDLEETDKAREMQSISVKLASMETGLSITSWGSRRLEQTTAFDFDPKSPVLAGEYRLLAEIKDELSGASSVSECALRVDYSELLISPAESIKTRRNYNGQEVLLVQPGYNVNFYVHEGFRDVGIEYCLKRLETADVRPDMAEEHLRCEMTQDFLNTKSQSLDEGFWVLNYRGRRGLVQNAWQHAVFLVDKVCIGTFTSMEDLKGKACTTIKGSLSISDLTEENAAVLDSIGVIYGNVELVRNHFDFSTVFANLTQLLGNLTVEMNGSENLDGFASLTQVLGNLVISNNHMMKTFRGFKALEVISGRLELHNSEYLEIMEGFRSLISVESELVIDNVAIKDLSFLKNLQLARTVSLRQLSLTSLKGLDSLRSIHHLSLNQVHSLENLGGFSFSGKMFELTLSQMDRIQSLKGFGAKTVDNLSIMDCPSLLLGQSNENQLEINSSLNVTNIQGVHSLKGFKFSDSFEYFMISRSPLQSLGGVEAIKELRFLNLFGVEGEFAMDSFSNLETLMKFELSESQVEKIGRFPSLLQLGDLVVSKNPKLTALPGLPSGISVERIGIMENESLVDLDSLLAMDLLLNDSEIHVKNCLDSNIIKHLERILSKDGEFESRPIEERLILTQGGNCPLD